MTRILITFTCLFFCLNLNAEEPETFLSQEEITTFYEQGYLIKRQCLSADECKDLQKKLTASVDQALDAIKNSKDQSISTSEQFLHIEGSKIIFKRPSSTSISIARINGIGGMQPSLLKIGRSEKMLRTFFALLGTSDLEHLIFQVHPKMPGDGIAFPKHRDIQFRQSYDPDWQDILGNGSYAICVIPVDPMTQENGGLWIDKNNYPIPQDKEEERVWIEAQPGDLLFMHPYLFHGSGPNQSPTASRKTLLTGFCAFGANHKTYPGTAINTRITLKDNNTIEMQPSPWGQPDPTSEGNH
ncbi:MAG: phytanoyl-CoA dioxygenase family protein [Rhabdochlamydiaceae bacterium]|nr:phytanoyl-CoA dioxygenase family protein [Rhabdochlamydiaceae bacterium]